ncbi:hypothetical protein LUZ61_004403 [Rhynchospora tenuis]|uniref:Glutamine amidotransferase domain-containing protein n=1 Tax=Rhynchospora tenuis TaxID=198213 RepID=A0AAD5ZMS9_9POAL|nr:hypothetical protein LUZ61_004403 [Rhynchospora tenuis]
MVLAMSEVCALPSTLFASTSEIICISYSQHQSNNQQAHKPEDIITADCLFPGVGAAMQMLNQTGKGEVLRMYIDKDQPFLGICLGLRLLFDSSEENGPVKGLGAIPGTVGHFDSTQGQIVPHIGWNALQPVKDSGILQGIEGHYVYFSEDNKDWISSLCYYGESFVSSVSRGNILVPEKASKLVRG